MRRRQFFRSSGVGAGAFLLWHAGCGSSATPPAGIDAGASVRTDAGADGGAAVDAGRPEGRWWTEGNYAPVDDEIDVSDLEVEGALPPELSGVFLRNGPNPPSGRSIGWFFGDAMLHGVRFEGGRALWYRNRFLRSEAYVSGATQNEMATLTQNLGNTSIVRHAGVTFTTYETEPPTQIIPADLSTVGEYDFDGALEGSMTAHPKIDPVTGEMIFFGYKFTRPFVTLHWVDAGGQLVRSVPMDLPRPRMFHDFQVTEDHILFFDLPVGLSFEAVIAADRTPFVWEPEHGARIGVMRRDGDGTDVRWFDVPPCYVFHTVNAYDRAGAVVVEASRHDHFYREGPEDWSSRSELYRWEIPTTGGGEIVQTQLDDRIFEFPRIDPRRHGRPHRVAYGLEYPAVPGIGEPPAPNGLIRYVDGAVEDSYTFAAGRQPDEAVFVPDEGDEAEDAGWVLTMVYDAAENRSFTAVFEANDLTAGPVARVWMPRRVPFGFHGEWFPSEAL